MRFKKFFIFALFCLSLLSIVTAKDNNPPSPVKTEVVFPEIIFGEDIVEFQTDIIVVNSSPNDAYVEFNLYDQNGIVPSLDLIGREDWTGYWRVIVRPNSVRSLEFPSRASRPLEEGLLLGPLFVGWGILRSDEKVEVFQRIRTLDVHTRRLQRAGDFLGNSTGVKSARFLVHSKLGIAILNPDGHAAQTLKFQLWEETDYYNPDADPRLIEEREMVLPPRNQKAFLLDRFFGSNLKLGDKFVQIESVNGPSEFAFIPLGYQYTRNYGYYVSTTLSASTISKWGRSKVDQGNPFDFPIPIEATETLGDLTIKVTRFGFYAKAQDETAWELFNYGGGEKIKVNNDVGIGIIDRRSGNRKKAIFFADTKKVLIETLPGSELLPILDLPELNAIEVGSLDYSVGYPRFALYENSVYLLIDKDTQEVIQRFRAPSGSTPPWRK